MLKYTTWCLIVGTWISLCVPYTACAQVSESDQAQLEAIFSILRSKPDSAIRLLRPLLQHPVDSTRGKALNYMGNAFYYTSNYDSAIRYYAKSAIVFEQVADEENAAKCYNNIGVSYFFLSQFEKAFEYHKKAMIIRERTGDPQIASSYNNMGLVLSELGSIDEALNYYKKSLNAKITHKLFGGLSTTLTNISGIFRDRNELDSALYYDFKNLNHLDSVPDTRNLATCYNNLSVGYIRSNSLDKAGNYARKALVLEKKLQRGYEIVNVCSNLATIYIKQKQFKTANLYLDSAFTLVKDIGTFRSVVQLYYLQSKADSLLGNKEAAYIHLHDYMRAKSYFDQLEQKNLVLELEKKYEGELKEEQILKLEQANTIKDLEANRALQWRIYLTIVLLLLIVIALVMYSRLQIKKRTARTLDEKNQELEQINQYKNRLFAIISHDLKSPLSSFSSITSTLNDYFDHISPDDAKSYLTKLANSARALEGQMKNLLEWAMSQLSDRTLKMESIHVKSQIDELKAFFQLNLDIKKQQLYIDAPDDLILFSDKEYLQTILRNLLSNAIKFTPSGGSIWVVAQSENNMCTLLIRDSGIGIAREDFVKLFSLTADKKSIGTSTEKGTGLGLVLVKEMVDKLGGEISLESEPGKGTIFSIRLRMEAANLAA
jgi:signal transduction histidine kinase